MEVLEIATIHKSGQELVVCLGTYKLDQSMCIILKNKQTREVVCKATSICVHAQFDRNNCVLIKDYGENFGIVDILQSSNIIGERVGEVCAGFALLGVYEMLIKSNVNRNSNG